MAQLNFNATTVAPDTGTGDPLPAGWYNVMMDESEMKPTRAGDGSYLACSFKVLDGQYAGRKVFTNLNLRNPNAVTQEIAYKQLSAICHAVGVLQVVDSSELHGKPLKVKVKVRKATEEYEASNDISAFKNINDPTAGATGPTAGAAPQGFGQMPAQMPMQQQPMQQPMGAQQFQQPQQFQQFQQPMQQPPMQQPMQQPQFQQPQQMQAQAPQFQQPMQPQQQPQQPAQQPAAAAQPWEQPGAAAQPWAGQPQMQQQQFQQPAQQPMQPQAAPQQAAPNPAVQQFAGAVPPWQQQPAQ